MGIIQNHNKTRKHCLFLPVGDIEVARSARSFLELLGVCSEFGCSERQGALPDFDYEKNRVRARKNRWDLPQICTCSFGQTMGCSECSELLGVCSEFVLVDVQTMKESMRVVGFCQFSQVLNVLCVFVYVLLVFFIFYCVESVCVCFASVRSFVMCLKCVFCFMCFNFVVCASTFVYVF